MSVDFNPNKVSYFSLEDWSVTVCAWRGCCLEVFSRAEHSVADCLSTLAAAGIALSRDACSPAAITRLRALDACLARYRFGGHEREARRLVEEWGRINEGRASLAHGQLVPTATGVTIHHRVFDGKAQTRRPPQVLSTLEMLSQLKEIEGVQIALHNQLGQIKAAAGTATPLSAA